MNLSYQSTDMSLDQLRFCHIPIKTLFGIESEQKVY